MDQYEFLSNFHIVTFYKNAPFSSFKNIRVEYDGEGLETLGTEHTISSLPFLHLLLVGRYSAVPGPGSK
jgi:hypothetical protein